MNPVLILAADMREEPLDVLLKVASERAVNANNALLVEAARYEVARREAAAAEA